MVGWEGIYPSTGGQNACDMGWAYGVHQRRLITFSLEGEVEMSSLPEPFFPQPLDVPGFRTDQSLVINGADLYYRNGCSRCHGGAAI